MEGSKGAYFETEEYLVEVQVVQNIKDMNIVNKLTKQESDTIWELKAFFIFTIFFAHMPIAGGGVVSSVFHYLGMVGVPSFFIMSGFLDAGSLRPLFHRLKSLLIPLFIWGVVTFAIQVLLHHSYNFFSVKKLLRDCFLWIYGSGTWLYFVPVLLWCIIMVRYVNKWLLIALSLISIVLSESVIPYNQYFTPFVNPFNYLAFFVFGRLVREYQWNLVGTKQLIISIITVAGCLLLWNEYSPNTTSLYYVPFAISVYVMAYNLFSNWSQTWLIRIGQVSFVVYFCHMQIAGKVNTLLSFLWGTPFEFIKVFIAFVVVLLFVLALQYLLKTAHCEKALRYLGFR